MLGLKFIRVSKRGVRDSDHWLRFVFLWIYHQFLRIYAMHLPIFSCVTCLALGQLWDCPSAITLKYMHDDVIKRKHFPRYWPFVTGEFPSQRPVTRSFNVFFDLRLNKRLSKQSGRRWFGTPSRSLWRHCIGVKWTITCPQQHKTNYKSYVQLLRSVGYWGKYISGRWKPHSCLTKK